MDNRKIGVFDSGVGGLTVVKSLFHALPKEKIVYYADSLHVPYGGRTKEDITRLALGITDFLKSKGVKAVVIACNTVSALCADELRAAADMPVIDVLTPGAAAVARSAKRGVGVIATHNVVRQGAHERLIHRENPALYVYARECPLLVPIAEEGLGETEIAYAAARHYLAGFDAQRLDAVLLGCTHYPLLENALRAATDIPLIDPADYAAAELKNVLAGTGSLAGGGAIGSDADGGNGGHEFFTSGDAGVFGEQLRRALGDGFSCRSAV